MSKASIKSPIDGVVLTRSVDPGNAVAASLQAVTLFTVAEDLQKLRLEVAVDEADVGSVQPGQRPASPSAPTPRATTRPSVTRVDYGSTKTDNVVTYVARLDVDNHDLSLRPGMTASATINATERNDVLLVPNPALRFTPTPGRCRQQGQGRRWFGRSNHAARAARATATPTARAPKGAALGRRVRCGCCAKWTAKSSWRRCRSPRASRMAA